MQLSLPHQARLRPPTGSSMNVAKQFSRKYSEGDFFRFRTAGYFDFLLYLLSHWESMKGSQPMLFSTSTSCKRGKRSNTPEKMMSCNAFIAVNTLAFRNRTPN